MNHEQFRALFDLHAAFVWRVLARHGVPRRELEDGCQEVFLVLHRRASELIPGANVRTWLYGVAVRVALAMRRRAYHRREQLTDVAPEQGGPAQPFEALWSRELHQQLVAALDSLPRVLREVFVLYELEDMTLTEAAEALGARCSRSKRCPASANTIWPQSARVVSSSVIQIQLTACGWTRSYEHSEWSGAAVSGSSSRGIPMTGSDERPRTSVRRWAGIALLAS